MRFSLFALAVYLSLQCVFSFTLPIRELSSDSNTVNFLSLGDWGSVNSDQSNVAKTLGVWAASENPLFLWALGDNFYEDGVTSDTDSQWTTTYKNVFNNPSLNVPWYALLGNHDHHKKRGQGEIDYYLNKRDSRWFEPSFWYSATWSAATADGQHFTIQGIFIDTVLLIGGDDAGVNQTQVKEQTEWIEGQLKASTADWLFVSGHYPVYSGGEHGNTAGLVNTFKPLFDEYQVDGYFCGHDHTLQHLKSGNVHYWVSGNGAKRGTYSSISQSLFGVVDPGFGVHYLNSTHMTTKLIDGTNKVVYQYTQPRNKKAGERRVQH